MSTLAYSYPEPYKLPAGVLAVVVHGAFFALLYFGINWHSEQPQGMVVDIWNSLPAAQVETVKVEPPPVQAETPKPIEKPKLAEPVLTHKADIELVEKKKPKVKVPEPSKPVAIKPVQTKIIEKPQVDQQAQAAQAAQAAAGAAIASEVGKYTGLIRSRIRRNIVMPPDVADHIAADFEVSLLPDGELLGDPKLVKSSGNAAYDAAVGRSIVKAQPLPLPSDLTAKKEFINPKKLQLKFRPKE